MIVAKGAVYHLLGPLVPAGDNVPKYAQLYMMDNQSDQVDQRMSHFQNSYMTRELLHRLQSMLHTCNTLVQQFRQTIQDIQDQNHALEESEMEMSTTDITTLQQDLVKMKYQELCLGQKIAA